MDLQLAHETITPSVGLIGGQGIFNLATLERYTQLATLLAQSTVIPQQFQGSPANILVALDVADRANVSPLMVMQNLFFVDGQPCFTGKYCVAAINRKYKDVNYAFSGDDDAYGCCVVAIHNDKELRGSTITVGLAKVEGWWDKPGSKWATMTDQMLRYRAASFFAKAFAPEVLMGMLTIEEVLDIQPYTEPVPKVDQREAERVKHFIDKATTEAAMEQIRPHIKTPDMQVYFDNKLSTLKQSENGSI